MQINEKNESKLYQILNKLKHRIYLVISIILLLKPSFFQMNIKVSLKNLQSQMKNRYGYVNQLI